MSEPILRTRDLTKRFGGLTAVDDVSRVLEVPRVKVLVEPQFTLRMARRGLLERVRHRANLHADRAVTQEMRVDRINRI